MSEEEVIVIEGMQMTMVTEVLPDQGGKYWYALVTVTDGNDPEKWFGPCRPALAVAERDAASIRAAALSLADGYVAPATATAPTPPPTVATHTIANVGGIARDRWTLGERHAEARWDADARMWRADVWGAGGHECTYWAPSAETAAAAAAVMLGEVAS